MVVYVDRLWLVAFLSVSFARSFAGHFAKRQLREQSHKGNNKANRKKSHGGSRVFRILENACVAFFFVVLFCIGAGTDIGRWLNKWYWWLLFVLYVVGYYVRVRRTSFAPGRDTWYFVLGHGLLGCFVSGIGLLVPSTTESYSGGIFAMLLAGGFLNAFARWRRQMAKQNCCDVRITHHERQYFLKGFVDTGNLLRGPSGEPVCVLREQYYDEIFCEEHRNEMSDEQNIVCYLADGSVGVMPCLVVDMVELSEQRGVAGTEAECETFPKDICMRNVTMAKGGMSFCRGYDVLLPEWK